MTQHQYHQQQSQQPAPRQALPAKLAHPRRRDIFFHSVKTGKLITALTRDGRVSLVRKFSFFAAVLALLGILLFPDIFGETVLSVVLPFVGTILGVPIDIGFDWAAFALLVVSLLRIFPAEIVGEHYQRLFHRS